MSKEYWIDADGYLVYGIREKNEWESVAEIPQKHVEPLCQILYSQSDLLDACKLALKEWYPSLDGCSAPDCLVCARHEKEKEQVKAAITKAEPQQADKPERTG